MKQTMSMEVYMKSGSKAKTLNFEKPLVGLYPHISNVMAMYGNNEYIMPSLISEMLGMVYDRELNRLDFSISL